MPERTTFNRSGSRKRPTGVERRAWVRYPCDNAATFRPLGKRARDGWQPAQVATISAKGIGLLLDIGLERGTILSLKLDGASERFTRPLLVRVVRVVQRAPNLWQIGCSFAIPLDADELQVLLPGKVDDQRTPQKKAVSSGRLRRTPPRESHDPFVDGSVHERRNHHRRRIAVSVVVFYGSAFQMMQEAVAIDAAIGGLKLQSRQAFSPGTMLRIRNAKAPRNLPSVEVRVKSCRPQQATWILGVQFLRPPSAETMMYFG